MPPERFYPVFLRLRDLPVVVVGGGTVAAGKLDGLVEAGARVTVVAPDVCDAIRARGDVARGDVAIVQAAFRPAHLAGARWVVAAATPAVNRDVADAAAARGLFVNAVDDTSAATAYLGGVVRRGEVEIAISTGGLAPALAGLLREALDAVLPHDLHRWMEVARRARTEWKAARIPIAERRPLLLRALDKLYATRATDIARTDIACDATDIARDDLARATDLAGDATDIARGTSSKIPRDATDIARGTSSEIGREVAP